MELTNVHFSSQIFANCSLTDCSSPANVSLCTDNQQAQITAMSDPPASVNVNQHDKYLHQRSLSSKSVVRTTV